MRRNVVLQYETVILTFHRHTRVIKWPKICIAVFFTFVSVFISSITGCLLHVLFIQRVLTAVHCLRMIRIAVKRSDYCQKRFPYDCLFLWLMKWTNSWQLCWLQLLMWKTHILILYFLDVPRVMFSYYRLLVLRSVANGKTLLFVQHIFFKTKVPLQRQTLLPRVMLCFLEIVIKI